MGYRASYFVDEGALYSSTRARSLFFQVEAAKYTYAAADAACPRLGVSHLQGAVAVTSYVWMLLLSHFHRVNLGRLWY